MRLDAAGVLDTDQGITTKTVSKAEQKAMLVNAAFKCMSAARRAHECPRKVSSKGPHLIVIGVSFFVFSDIRLAAEQQLLSTACNH